MLPDVLSVTPFTAPVRGTVSLPGSKSITNRALLLAAMCPQPVRLTGALHSEDTALMSDCLRRLGFTVEEIPEQDEIRIAGGPDGITAQEADLFVGLAGTAARFLTAFCAAAPRGRFRIDGVEQMRRRPMAPLLKALRELGADIRCLGEEGFLPVEVHARGLQGGTIEMDARESSQLASALLAVAPLAQGSVTLRLAAGMREPYVAMTVKMMRAFAAADPEGLVSRPDERTWQVAARPQPYACPSGTYPVEPDASAASYFLALPLVTGGQLLLQGARDAGEGLQGDTVFADVIRQAGASVQATPEGLEISATAGGATGLERDFHAISDTFLTFAAIAPLLKGPTRITGIAHTRLQETDRLAGMAHELRRLGQAVEEGPDFLRIDPRPLVAGKTVDSYGDHRFAMSFGILGCANVHGDGRPWLALRDPSCSAKTFPAFFGLLEDLRRKSLAS